MGANVTVVQIIHSLAAQAVNRTLCLCPQFMGQIEQNTHEPLKNGFMRKLDM